MMSSHSDGSKIDAKMISRQLGQRAPDFDQALPDEIDAPAVEALQRARQHADRDARQRERHQHRQPKSVQQPREDVAAELVGAEPVARGRRRRVWPRREIVDRVVAAVRRVDREIAARSILARMYGSR
jgi:hypothetical protein